jgi:hypothetical protein
MRYTAKVVEWDSQHSARQEKWDKKSNVNKISEMV